MSDDRGTVRWFGPASWGASVCEPESRIDIPVGKFCLDCHVKIEREDRGLVIPYSRTQSGHYPPASPDEWIVTMEPHHLVCFLHAVGIRDQHLLPGPTRQLTGSGPSTCVS